VSDDEAFDLSGVMQGFDPRIRRFRLCGPWIDVSSEVVFEERPGLSRGMAAI